MNLYVVLKKKKSWKFSKRDYMLKKLDLNKLPRHIGVIVDGNGRWALKRGLPRNLGHKAGILAIKEFVKNAKEIGIKCVTFYCFSTENWKRPQDEIDAIFQYANDFLVNEQIDYKKENVRKFRREEKKNM